MTLLDLRNSNEPILKLKSYLLTEGEVSAWLQDSAVIPITRISKNGLPVKTKVVTELRLSNLFNNNYNETALFIIGMRVMNTDTNEKLRSIFGHNVIETVTETRTYLEWQLSVKDWPFILLEIIESTLSQQKREGTRVIPPIIRDCMKHVFPNSNYLELLDWYKNDLITLNPYELEVPLLRNLLENQAVEVPKNSAALPTGLEFD